LQIPPIQLAACVTIQARQQSQFAPMSPKKQNAGRGKADEIFIPDKLYFRIGEVSRLAGIKPYVLRFWETEFSSLGPKKSGKGHRLYRRKDVELVLEIKRLLYDKRYTIEGARKFLDARSRESGVKSSESAAKAAQPQPALFTDAGPALKAIREELAEILQLLS
jgi:DNA-binding transcriptional MerR regulator